MQNWVNFFSFKPFSDPHYRSEINRTKLKLIAQREDVENQLKKVTDNNVEKAVIQFYDNIRAILDQREKDIREQISQQKVVIKQDFEKDLKYIQNQIDLTVECEKVQPVDSSLSSEKLVEYLEKFGSVLQMFDQVKEPNSNTFKVHEKPQFDSTLETDQLWDLIKDQRTDIVPEKEKSVSKSRKTFYNRPMPKATTNVQKSSIPKINKNSITDVREKKVRNVSSFSRQNIESSTWNQANPKLNRSTASVSHRAYTTSDGSKHKIRPELEEKFTSGVLPPKQPNLKSKHNFKGNSVSGKCSPIHVPSTSMHDFHTNMIPIESKKKLNFEHSLKNEIKDFKSFWEEFSSNGPTDDAKEQLSHAYKATTLKKSASVLRSKNASCSLMEKRNMRKQEKQDSIVRESINVPDQFSKHFSDLQKVANVTLDKWRRSNLMRNSSQNAILSSSMVQNHSEYADRRYENHSHILSKITKNLKSVRHNKENNNFEFSNDVIKEAEIECLGQSGSIVDLRKNGLNDISLNQMSPIKDEITDSESKSKNHVGLSTNNYQSLSNLQKNINQ